MVKWKNLVWSSGTFKLFPTVILVPTCVYVCVCTRYSYNTPLYQWPTQTPNPTCRTPASLPHPHVGLVGCGEALGVWGIRRTPEGGAGRVGYFSRILQIFIFQEARPWRLTCPKNRSKKYILSTSPLALTFPSKAQTFLRNALQRISSWGSKSVKIT